VTPQEITALAQAAGSGGDVSTAVAVALAESGGNPAAVGVNGDGSRDRGLWQINSRWHPEVSDACAFDPSCNARAAYVISNGWTDFGPWTTYSSGAYRQYLPPDGGTVTQAPPSRSLQGQGVVGQLLSSPWFQGTWEVTQGWGPTDYGGEPEGHGYAHWHAGVDIGLDSGTLITMPAGLTGRAVALDNPNGYGTALVVLVDGGPGIVLGHLRQRLVDDGAVIAGGSQLAVSDSTGNSTGPHLHFEVRPQDSKQPLGISRYGTDVDPSAWLLTATGSDYQLLAAQSGDQGLAGILTSGVTTGVATVISGVEVLVGAALVVLGLVASSYGARGKTAGDLGADIGRLAARRAARRTSSAPRTRTPAPVRLPASETRVRPDLQLRVPSAS
jgi:murein DD-endopeptidase MepM/ murein hydrolase activator NlpD